MKLVRGTYTDNINQARIQRQVFFRLQGHRIIDVFDRSGNIDVAARAGVDRSMNAASVYLTNSIGRRYSRSRIYRKLCSMALNAHFRWRTAEATGEDATLLAKRLDRIEKWQELISPLEKKDVV